MVAGGGIAGLLAARVLADVADEVVVLDPDHPVAGAAPRPGVPHGRQLHVLLEMGQVLLERWLPGVLAELAALEATRCGLDGDAVMYVDGRARPAVSTDAVLGVGRPLLERVVRGRVEALAPVRLRQARVTGLTMTGTRVDGVRIEAAEGIDRLASDLVVDATGRAGRLDGWLRRLGYPPPPKQRVMLDLSYATATFHRRPGQRFGGRLIIHSMHSASAAHPGVNAIVPLEDCRWGVVLAGYGADRAERDLPSFLRRCRAEPLPYFGELVEDCAPAGDVVPYRFPATVRRDWHRSRALPGGVVAMGDAVASLNPVYGQGMTVAALHGCALAAWLRSDPPVDRPADRYFESVRVLTDAAWQGTAVEDLRLPHAYGDRPAGYPLLRGLNALISRAAMTDPVVARQFLDVIGLRIHPSELARPSILLRAAAACLRR